MLLGWVIDDSFGDFRAWLISRGRASFEAAVEDPDSLADLADELLVTQWAIAEQLDPIVRWVAYETATGEFPPENRADAPGQGKPRGERIDLADERAVREHFRLFSLVLIFHELLCQEGFDLLRQGEGFVASGHVVWPKR